MNQEARKAFNTIEQSLASKAHRKLLRVATNAFLEADGNPRPEHAEGASASSLSRFFNDYNWNLRGIIRILRQNILRQLLNLARQKRTRKHVLKLMLDLTSLLAHKTAPVGLFALEKTGEFLTTKCTWRAWSLPRITNSHPRSKTRTASGCVVRGD